MRRAVVRLVAIAMLAAAARRSGGQVVVQPGEDVQAAIVGVRERPRPRVVELAAGLHVLTRPLVLTGADSGLILQGPAIGEATIVGTRSATIDGCEFGGLGGYALDIGRGSQVCRARSCVFDQLGAGGARIGETRPEEGSAASVTGHVVEACDVHDYGRTHLGAVGLIVLHASHVRLARNEVHHGNYTAVSVGWTWGYADSPCHHNLVEENSLHHVGNDLLSDLGGVYLLGPQPGTVVRRNRIHDIRRHDYGGWGLYTDEGSSGMLLEENIVWNCASAGFHQHYGRDNMLRNNLFVDCGEGGIRRSRDEPHRSFTFEHNVVVCREPRFVSGNWKDGDTILRNNLYFSPAEGAPTWNGRTRADWQSAGRDTGSRFADPKLVDPSRPDRGLEADSPAFEMGIRIPALANAAGDSR